MADLKITHIEKLTLGDSGGSYNSTIDRTITGINNALKTKMIISDVETTVYSTATVSSSPTILNNGHVRYARITNKSSLYKADVIVTTLGSTEYCRTLGPLDSMYFYGHDETLLAKTTALTVAAGAHSTGTIAVADGDDNVNVPTELDYIEIPGLNADTTSTLTKKYVCVDANAGSVATGTVLAEGSDYGSGTLTAGHAAIGGIAVATNITGTKSTQNAWLKQMEIAIEGVTGHNGIIVCAVPPEATGAQNLVMVNYYPGAVGNAALTESITHADYTKTDMASGVTGGVASLEDISAITAIAHGRDVEFEFFVASI